MRELNVKVGLSLASAPSSSASGAKGAGFTTPRFHSDVRHLLAPGDGNLVAAVNHMNIDPILPEHGLRVFDPLLLDDNWVSLGKDEAKLPSCQAGRSFALSGLRLRSSTSQLLAEQLPDLVVLPVNRRIPDRAHVGAHEAGVACQLPPDHVSDLNVPSLPRHGDLIKVDVGILALWHVDTRSSARLQPVASQGINEEGRKYAFRIEQPALEGDVRAANQSAGADEGEGANKVRMVGGEGGCEGAAEGVAEEMKGGRAGPGEC